MMLLCVAEGYDDRWEAFCLDFDLAVQGHSLRDVEDKLNVQIELFLEGVNALPEEQRAPLLKRRMPWYLQAKYLLIAMVCLVASVFARKESGTAVFRVPNATAAA